MLIMRIVPTVTIAWALYHIVWFLNYSAFATDPVAVLDASLFTIPLPKAGRWIVSSGDIVTAFTVLTGFIEVAKASSLRRIQMFDHLLAMVLLCITLIEFLYFQAAQTSVFFFIVLAIFLDVTVGYVVGIRVARRDFSIEEGGLDQ